METLGTRSHKAGYNLKNEVLNLLKKNNIEFTSIKHYVEDPYEKRHCKPEYVGQCVWVFQKGKSSVLVRQTDLDGAPSNWLEDYLTTALD